MPTEIRPLWDILVGGGPVGLLFLVVLAIITGNLVPKFFHTWAVMLLKDDRDQWRSHAQDLKRAVERLAILLEGRRR
jgi:hypothetical protein